MKRIIAVLAVAGIGVGGATAAWAQTTSSDKATVRQALQTCVQQSKSANPSADATTLKASIKSCMVDAGVLKNLTPDQKTQAKACIAASKQANPDADKVTVRADARPCLQQAGIVQPLTPEQQATRSKLLGCYEQAKTAHPGDRKAIRQATKACFIAA